MMNIFRFDWFEKTDVFEGFYFPFVIFPS